MRLGLLQPSAHLTLQALVERFARLLQRLYLPPRLELCCCDHHALQLAGGPAHVRELASARCELCLQLEAACLSLGDLRAPLRKLGGMALVRGRQHRAQLRHLALGRFQLDAESHCVDVPPARRLRHPCAQLLELHRRGALALLCRLQVAPHLFCLGRQRGCVYVQPSALFLVLLDRSSC